MIAIIDYGVGNLFSLSHSLTAVGADVSIKAARNMGYSLEKAKE